ncbi:leucine--tRNA ligase [Spirochaetota bacterium]|nr:leucine--tRNA ligase [Spirochaetota bacterium]
MEYDFKTIEEKWRNHYETTNPFRFDPHKPGPKYYCLEMFPYPSGNLHMGHVRTYTLGDVLARYKMLKQFNVLHPIGWDAFGLPAENAAIENNIPPSVWTFKNIAIMRNQLKSLGLSYDYNNEVCTATADYYKWGQWLFLKLYDKGLVYRAKAWVNWDPVDKTVLANEQVVDGKAWRSGAPIEKKLIEQWFFKITAYAEELLTSLATLDKWPYKIKAMQRNWIGKSSGAIVYFKIASKKTPSAYPNEGEFPIFTTRPDTLYGATFMAIAFNHPAVHAYIDLPAKERETIIKFIDECKNIDQHSDYAKKGIFTGTFIDHPLTDEKLPLYVANFVLAEYGTGAIMGCPGQDARDYAFAKAHELPIKHVVCPADTNIETYKNKPPSEAFTEHGITINSQFLTGIPTALAIEKMTTYLEEKKLGRRKIQYKLKDWLISRQRYWGNPIPMLKDEKGTFEKVPLSDLPVILPQNVTFTGTKSPLADHPEFTHYQTNDNRQVKREHDTMDTFTCSSWYFLRYIDAHNKKEPFAKALVQKWMPVDQYIGGIEHACLHLLYARFFQKALRDLGITSNDEPFPSLLAQGMVTAKSYYAPKIKKYLTPDEVSGHLQPHPSFTPKPTEEITNITDDNSPTPNKNLHYHRTYGQLIVKVEKMSKSKKNGIAPEKMVDRYGADSVRLFILFAAPPEKNLEWNENGIEGCQRFLLKLVRYVNQFITCVKALNSTENSLIKPSSTQDSSQMSSPITQFNKILHPAIQKVELDIDRLHFNTAIAMLMETLNKFQSIAPKTQVDCHPMYENIVTFLTLLNPFAPFVTEELNAHLYQNLCNQLAGIDSFAKKLYEHTWPTSQKIYLTQPSRDLIVQVNGKIRAKLSLLPTLNKNTVISHAKKEPNIKKWLANQTIVKEVYLPQKILNFVTKPTK